MSNNMIGPGKMKIKKIIFAGLAFLLVFTLVSLAVMWLWNYLLPHIFGLKLITFPEAAGLLALSRLLFGNFGKRGGRPGRGGSRQGRMREKMSSMSDEEKQLFRERWRNRCNKQ